MSYLGFIAEYVGIVASAISGSLLGLRKNFDLFGIVFLAIINTIGGGVTRDLLLGYIPPRTFVRPTFVVVATVVSLLVMLFYRELKNPLVEQLSQSMLYFDAIGLAAFTAIGLNYALLQHPNMPFLAISVAVITGVGGGILRDILANRVPLVFKKDIYAVAALIGGLVGYYAYLWWGSDWSIYLCMGVTAVIRVLAIRFNIQIPPFEIDIRKNWSGEKKN